MMRVVFFDTRRETYVAVNNVIQLSSEYSRINGRVTKIWMLRISDDTTRTFVQKHYPMHRIEI